mmetsp:Transcript_29467/g.74024  ORF Transcript_29467/g.74024 Transcript_29467/m.74024 type:complete len:401 (+) Transcript_29467:556-1758(+)
MWRAQARIAPDLAPECPPLAPRRVRPSAYPLALRPHAGRAPAVRLRARPSCRQPAARSGAAADVEAAVRGVAPCPTDSSRSRLRGQARARRRRQGFFRRSSRTLARSARGRNIAGAPLRLQARQQRPAEWRPSGSISRAQAARVRTRQWSTQKQLGAAEGCFPAQTAQRLPSPVAGADGRTFATSKRNRGDAGRLKVPAALLPSATRELCLRRRAERVRPARQQPPAARSLRQAVRSEAQSRERDPAPPEPQRAHRVRARVRRAARARRRQHTALRRPSPPSRRTPAGARGHPRACARESARPAAAAARARHRPPRRRRGSRCAGAPARAPSEAQGGRRRARAPARPCASAPARTWAQGPRPRIRKECAATSCTRPAARRSCSHRGSARPRPNAVRERRA